VVVVVVVVMIKQTRLCYISFAFSLPPSLPPSLLCFLEKEEGRKDRIQEVVEARGRPFFYVVLIILEFRDTTQRTREGKA